MWFHLSLQYHSEQNINLSPSSFYHKWDELTIVKKRQLRCFSPFKAVKHVLMTTVWRHWNDVKNNLIEHTKTDFNINNW